MEMTSSVMRFALATYFMKRGYGFHHPSQSSELSWTSPTFEPIRIECDDVENGLNQEFSNLVSTHVSNLRQLLVEQRLHDWSRGVVELREYVISNKLVTSLVTLLVKLLKRHEPNAVCIVQIIEHMCFETKGEPSQVFDQFAELLLEALSQCCENKDARVAIWLLRAIHGVLHGLRQYHEQQYGIARQNQRHWQDQNMITDMIYDCLVESNLATKDK
ncbi:hypothetical protein KXD40_008623 [Peronospora effusa]|nr:hypothetical protein KXD40_008623 [Peronospora effusa]CAI5701038.1 unnamed protein product [Peronospora effusa]